MKNWDTLEADITMLVPVHFTPGRVDKIRYVVVHHNGGNLSTQGCYNVWLTREASAHYQVEDDGTIVNIENMQPHDETSHCAKQPVRYALDMFYHALLPAFCMALGGLAFLSRFTRSTLLDAMHQDFVRTAKAKGVSGRRLFFGHVLRSALIPFVTLFGLILPEMVAGSVIIESIFSWPGLGQLYLKAVYTRDYPVIMAESVLGAFLVLVGSVATDLGYYAADPRTRRG